MTNNKMTTFEKVVAHNYVAVFPLTWTFQQLIDRIKLLKVNDVAYDSDVILHDIYDNQDGISTAESMECLKEVLENCFTVSLNGGDYFY